MDVALLDHYNAGLTRVARIGGLVAVGQLPDFFDLSRSQAFRMCQALERARMCAIERPSPMVGFMLLSKSTTKALGIQAPIPPQRGKLHPQRIRNAVGRAAYFLKFDQVPQSMGDLSKRWSSKTSKTQIRLAEFVERQVKVWHAQAVRVKSEYQNNPRPSLRQHFEIIRRKIRPAADITRAGIAALKIIRGVYFLLDAASLKARFVFIERGAPPSRLSAIADMAARFGNATSIETCLDIACGSEHSKARIERIFEQTQMNLTVRILDLSFERFLTRDAVSIGQLVGPELTPILEAASHE